MNDKEIREKLKKIMTSMEHERDSGFAVRHGISKIQSLMRELMTEEEKYEQYKQEKAFGRI